jgi:hypothetical protein
MRGTDIAVNIAVLTALPPALIRLLLPYLTTNQVVTEPGQMDGRAVLAQERCDLARLAADIALLRRQSYGPARLRVYQRTGAAGRE